MAQPAVLAALAGRFLYRRFCAPRAVATRARPALSLATRTWHLSCRRCGDAAVNDAAVSIAAVNDAAMNDAAENAGGEAAPEAERQEEADAEQTEETRALYDDPPWPSSAPPALTQDAATWVDFEFERAGLAGEGEDGCDALPTTWRVPGSLPEPSVMWPHAALNEHRSRAFGLPRASGRGDEERNSQLRLLEANRDRLQSLWRLSSSHGISWDELDQAYVAFARAGKTRYDSWAKRPAKDGDKQGEPVAMKVKRLARERAVKYLERFCAKDQTPLEHMHSRVRRLSARSFTISKKRYLAPWRPGRLTEELRQLVAARMLRRETHERTHGLVSRDAS